MTETQAENNTATASLTVGAILAPLAAQLVCGSARVRFNGVSTDTRSLRAGELFVALSGANYDGHDFVSQAQQRGAAAVLVSRRLDLPIAQILVADTLSAYLQLAGWWRARWRGKLIAITGSVGKTTIKELLAALLELKAPVLASTANNNNCIGVAQTLLRLRPQHAFAVVEVGASELGEIARSASIVRPEVAIISCIAPAHLQGFGSIAQVAQEKAQLLCHLAAGGVGCLPLDDDYYPYLAQQLGSRRQLSFSLVNSSADAFITDYQLGADGSDLQLCYSGANIKLSTSLLGKHNLLNAALASSVALDLGVPPQQLRRRLAQAKPVARRMQMLKLPRLNIISDCYNSSPLAMRAALEFLRLQPQANKYLLLGDMLELGASAELEHRELGKYLGAIELSAVFTLGGWAQLSGQVLAAAGSDTKVYHHRSYPELQEHLSQCLPAIAAQGDALILVKASRSLRLERAIDFIEQSLSSY